MICLFDFERFSIESWFPFFKLTLYSSNVETEHIQGLIQTFLVLHCQNV